MSFHFDFWSIWAHSSTVKLNSATFNTISERLTFNWNGHNVNYNELISHQIQIEIEIEIVTWIIIILDCCFLLPLSLPQYHRFFFVIGSCKEHLLLFLLKSFWNCRIKKYLLFDGLKILLLLGISDCLHLENERALFSVILPSPLFLRTLKCQYFEWIIMDSSHKFNFAIQPN